MPETYELLFTQLRKQYQYALENGDFLACGTLLFTVSQFSPEGQEFLAFAELIKPTSPNGQSNGESTDEPNF